MQNSTRSGAIRDNSIERKGPTASDADRAGKAGDAVRERPFTIRPKNAVIEISDGKVAVIVTSQPR